MRIKPKYCPECGEPPIAILEQVLGDAELIYDPEKKAFDYAGETHIDWDTQTSVVVDKKGRNKVTCNNLHTWAVMVSA
jgi:hypothetical protein